MTGMNMGGSAVGAAPPAGAVLYAATGGITTTSDLYTVDPVTAATTSVGAIGFAMTGLSFRPSDSVLFGVTSNNSAANPRSLITIDPDTGAGTLVGALGVTSGLADISFRSEDTLYGYTPSTRTLYSVNTTTGTATQVSATAIPTSGQGYADGFDSTDVLYVFPKGGAGAFYIVDETTGGLTAQTALSGSTFAGGGIIQAATFDTDDLAWAIVIDTVPDWYLATIQVGASTITSVAQTADQLDALAWSVP